MFDNSLYPHFFMGANSPEGFVSNFNELYEPENGWFSYIIKGGPGTGKSTLMKKAAKAAKKSNIKTELVYCSSDPSSLDAVIFPDIKTCIIDGTAPHVMDPVFPGAADTIVNLGECWNADKFADISNEVIKTTKLNSNFHSRSQRYLSACGSLEKDIYKVVIKNVDLGKLSSFSKRLAKKIFKEKSDQMGKESFRFISAISPDGVIAFEDTLKLICENIYLIKDEYGVVSNIIMQILNKEAIRNGLDTIICSCPMAPSEKIDALIVPKLNIGFVCSNSWHPFKSITSYKTIYTKRFIDEKALSTRQERLNFNKKIEQELLSESILNLKKAKLVHDSLEALYAECMNFNMVDKVTDDIILKIMKRGREFCDKTKDI